MSLRVDSAKCEPRHAETMIERDEHSQQFVVIHNRVARDQRLRRASRGLLIEVLSLPPGTAISPAALADGGPEGRDALRSMISELEKYGYVVRKKGQDERGRWYTRLIFRETPAGETAVSPTPENPSSVPPAETGVCPGHTDDGFSGVGFPGAKDLKNEELKTKSARAGVREAPAVAAPAGLDTDMIISEIRNATGKTVTPRTAEQAGRQILGRRAGASPGDPSSYIRAAIRREANPAVFLPTPVPPQFTAPAVVPRPRPESIAAAHAAIAHLRRPA